MKTKPEWALVAWNFGGTTATKPFSIYISKRGLTLVTWEDDGALDRVLGLMWLSGTTHRPRIFIM